MMSSCHSVESYSHQYVLISLKPISLSHVDCTLYMLLEIICTTMVIDIPLITSTPRILRYNGTYFATTTDYRLTSVEGQSA